MADMIGHTFTLDPVDGSLRVAGISTRIGPGLRRSSWPPELARLAGPDLQIRGVHIGGLRFDAVPRFVGDRMSGVELLADHRDEIDYSNVEPAWQEITHALEQEFCPTTSWAFPWGDIWCHIVGGTNVSAGISYRIDGIRGRTNPRPAYLADDGSIAIAGVKSRIDRHLRREEIPIDLESLMADGSRISGLLLDEYPTDLRLTYATDGALSVVRINIRVPDDKNGWNSDLVGNAKLLAQVLIGAYGQPADEFHDAGFRMNWTFPSFTAYSGIWMRDGIREAWVAYGESRSDTAAR